MHDNRELVEERITRELGERVLPLVVAAHWPLVVEAGPTLDELTPFAVGQPWGKPWATTWFRFSGTVASEWSGADARRIEAMIDLGLGHPGPGFCWEGLVRDADGRAVHGLHPRRQAVAVASEPGPFSIVVEAASNPSFPQFHPSPLGSLDTAGDALQYTLARADLVLVDTAAEELLYDFALLDEVMRTRASRDQHRASTLRVLEAALDALSGGATPSEVRAILAPSLARPAVADTHRIVATGHAHIDTAWLWPTRETVRKCIRTFSSAIQLMDADPAHRFSVSQAQQYEWVRQREPELFERIKEKVAAGQWIPVGGQWVEADMNLPSGESLVRQIVQGQRFFQEHFGVRCTEMWIPDVFGYPAGLPQIFRAGGMSRFVTQKLSWNRTNRFPHHTFWWEGLDGSRVLTHFPPVDTYNAEMLPFELAGAVERFAEHGWSNWSLAPFGFGDGGGGPTREMLAYAHRLGDLDGMPHVELGSPSQFFAHVEAEAAGGAPISVWRGELYFETHRGTLTSQLRTKLGNQRCERLLREAELWATAASVIADQPFDPHELDEPWRDVLTQQFHDILPGSSIAWVHADAEDVFERVGDDLEQRIAATLERLAPGGTVLANAASVDRNEVVTIGGSPVRVHVPALGLARLAHQPSAHPGHDHVVVTDRSMANGRLAVSWDLHGHLTSVIDIERGRELIPAGELGAVLQLAADHPVRYDAWDVESWTIDQSEAIDAIDSVVIESRDPLRGVIAVHREFGPSSATVRYVLRAGALRLDIEISLDWHHDEHLLSMAFPVDVHADQAQCGIQFGAVKRPTHSSTSWDAAKFEVCAHRYVDVAEPNFGVAILNNGRYGHGIRADGRHNEVRVSLARAAKYPDPGADLGHHDVTLSIFPHGAGLADVVAEAERLNVPIRIVERPAADESADEGAEALAVPVVQVTGAGIEIDAVKPADDGSGDLVVRLHEATGNRQSISVAAALRIAEASACNLLEERQRNFEVSDGILAFTVRPFELVTLRLTLTRRAIS